MYHRRAEADIVDEQSSKTQPKTRDTLTRHGQNGGREKQCSLSEKRGKTPNVDDHQPSPEEDEPEKPAKSHSKELHPDEKVDRNPETGDQPPEKSDLESTSESASESESDLESASESASESESDLESASESASESAGVEEQEGEPGEPATLNPNERHFDEKIDSKPEIGDQPPEKGEAESESVGVEAQGSETDGETPVGAENDDFSAFSKQKLKENTAEK